ncbi:MAG: DUF6577 family protein [Sphaerochaetaceae bacterium]
MWANQAMWKLSNKTYSREELFKIFQNEKKNLTESAFRWFLYNMQKERLLFRMDYNTYSTVQPKRLPSYKPIYSEQSLTVMKRLEEKYPALLFVVFESMLLNEFLNHQIAQNTIYVQVEKSVSYYIFSILQQEHAGRVLYKPSKNDFQRYWTKDCIVVVDMVSQSPLSLESPHEMTVEKMLVDIVAEKDIAATFSPSELPFIFENVTESYRVDKRRMNRYAGRRGKAAMIGKYMGTGD